MEKAPLKATSTILLRNVLRAFIATTSIHVPFLQ